MNVNQNYPYKDMIPAFQTKEEEEKVFGLLVVIMSEYKLRKAAADVCYQFDKYETLESTAAIDEVKQAECECCGLKEDCTADYISKVKDSYSGNWVCGLCAEAVKERLEGCPKTAMQEAVSTHKDFCQNFNSTTRLNPKLSLTCAMREIAKRSRDNRNSKINSKIARSTSCVPMIDLNKNQSV